MAISPHVRSQLFEQENVASDVPQQPLQLDQNSEPRVIRLPPTTKGKVDRPTRRCGTPWTTEEHDRFLKGLEIFPVGPWKEIAAYVGTRSARQTMTHAQKYREKIARKARTQGPSVFIANTTSMPADDKTLEPLQTAVRSPAMVDDSVNYSFVAVMEEAEGAFFWQPQPIRSVALPPLSMSSGFSSMDHEMASFLSEIMFAEPVAEQTQTHSWSLPMAQEREPLPSAVSCRFC